LNLFSKYLSITDQSIRHLTHAIATFSLQRHYFFTKKSNFSKNEGISTPTMAGSVMEHLSSHDHQRLLQAIQQLYALRDLETFAVNALTILNQLVPSDIPEFHATAVQTGQVSPIFLPGFPGFTPEIHRLIQRHFGEHPLIQRLPQTLHGVYQISDFLSQPELHRLEVFYQQYLRPFDVEEQITFFLPNSISDGWHHISQIDANVVGVSLHRTQRFTERDRLILKLIRPHLSQAHCNAQQYQQLQQDLSQLQQSLNQLDLVILNAQGQVQRITPQAIAWLETYFPKFPGWLQLPDHLWAWVKHQVMVTQNPDRPKAGLPLRIQQNGKQLVIRLVVDPIAAQYLLLLEEQALSLSQLLELLGLSQRETEVLFWVMQGQGNKAIATQLSVSQSTVRKHLESIYHKLGVQSRTEAISQVLEKLGVLNPLPLD
jgi:DNA-binding CsgD family transcriptional regulator